MDGINLAEVKARDGTAKTRRFIGEIELSQRDVTALVLEIEQLRALIKDLDVKNKRLTTAYNAYDGSALERADNYIADLESEITTLKNALKLSCDALNLHTFDGTFSPEWFINKVQEVHS